MAWNTDTADKFTRITGFDFRKFLLDFSNFNDNKKQKIYNYYQGTEDLDGSAFNELDRLEREVKKAIVLLSLNKESFSMYDDWELFVELEEIETSLFTIKNSSKYLRSAIATGNFSPNVLVETTLSYNQTLERLAEDLNSDDPKNDWTQIFLQNQLTEEDYTPDGGVLLKVSFQGSDPLFLNSVIDNIDTSEKTFGKDIDSKITFVSDDIKVLTYKETLLQSINILSTLKRGDNPEFPDNGIDTSIAVGTTYGALSLPSLFRQIYENFASDDSFKSFAVTDAILQGDTIQISFQVKTRTDEIQEGILSI